jgi:hypothetical protein
MNLPWWDSLETVKVVHSFFESWALLFFAGVVICDVTLAFLSQSSDLEWPVRWNERIFRLSLSKRSWTAIVPAFSSSLCPYRLLRALSLLWFGIAILLEIAALPYSNRTDELSNQEVLYSQKQTFSSLEKAAQAVRATEELRNENLQLALQIQDRHVTPEQSKEMLGILRPYSGTNISIGFLQDTGSDSRSYSIEVAEVFCKAKWSVFQPIGISNSTPIRGFLIDLKSGSPSDSRLADIVRQALVLTGFPTTKPLEPTNGFTLGGVYPLCRWMPPEKPLSYWHPTAIEILVGAK